MDRLTINDMIMDGYFKALKSQGRDTSKLEDIYTVQRAEIIINQGQEKNLKD